jgi:hypothetical protein
MSIRRLSIAALALVIVCATGYQAHLSGQTDEIVVKVTSAGDRPISFRGAIMFQEGGLQLLDRQTTPFEVRGREVWRSAFSSASAMAPRSESSFPMDRAALPVTAGASLSGTNVVRGVNVFARTF